MQVLNSCVSDLMIDVCSKSLCYWMLNARKIGVVTDHLFSRPDSDGFVAASSAIFMSPAGAVLSFSSNIVCFGWVLLCVADSDRMAYPLGGTGNKGVYSGFSGLQTYSTWLVLCSSVRIASLCHFSIADVLGCSLCWIGGICN